MGKKSREKKQRRIDLGSRKTITKGPSYDQLIDASDFIRPDGKQGTIQDVLEDYADANSICIMCGSPDVTVVGVLEIPHNLALQWKLTPGAVTGYSLCSQCEGVSNEKLGARIVELHDLSENQIQRGEN